MKAVIIYDDPRRAGLARAWLGRIAVLAPIDADWRITPWRIDLLRWSATATAARADAKGAHLILLAVRRAPPLPSGLLGWLEGWARSREIPDAALAVFSAPNDGALPAPATTALRRLAGRHHLEFLSAPPSVTQPAPRVLSEAGA